jgi:hypothetical protein
MLKLIPNKMRLLLILLMPRTTRLPPLKKQRKAFLLPKFLWLLNTLLLVSFPSVKVKKLLPRRGKNDKIIKLKGSRVLTYFDRIAELDIKDNKKKLREESRNALETFVYRVQDFLYNDVVGIVATENEVEKLRDRLSETSDWLYDEGEHADTPTYTTKLKELQ